MIKANKNLQTQFKVKEKRDSSLERKMSIVEDKITKEVVLPTPNHRTTRNRTNYLSKEDPYQISIKTPKIPNRMFSFIIFIVDMGFQDTPIREDVRNSYSHRSFNEGSDCKIFNKYSVEI
jgi:hypothetical protein